MTSGVVIAVDVSQDASISLEEVDEAMPSPWSALWRRLWRFPGARRVPSVVDIVEQAIFVASIRHRQRVAAEADLYLKPPVGEFGLMQFTALKKIEDIGYRYARERLAGWRP